MRNGDPKLTDDWVREVRADRRYANLKTLWDTRWTPNTEEFRDLIWHAAREAGNRKRLAIIVGIKPRHLRRILKGEIKAVSFGIADRILARSDVAYKMIDLPWLTVDELIEQGVWSQPFGDHIKLVS